MVETPQGVFLCSTLGFEQGFGQRFGFVKVILQTFEVKLFDFAARPRCFSQKVGAGLDGGIALKTIDRYSPSEFFP